MSADRAVGPVLLTVGKDKEGIVKVGRGTAKFAVEKLTAETATTVEVLKCKVASTGTAASGLGGYISFYVEDGAGNEQEQARIVFEETTVTNGSESTRLLFQTRQSGTLATRLTVDSSGTTTSSGDISFSAAGNFTIIDNSATALRIKEGSTAYMTFDTTNSAERILVSKQLEIADSTKLVFGDGDDVTIAWDGTDLDMLAAANNSVFKIGDGTASFDLWLYGSAAGNYWSWDASANDLKAEDNVSLMFGTGAGAGPGNAGDVELRWDGTDLDMLAAANNSIFKIGNGTNSFDVWVYGSAAGAYISWDASADDLKFEDSVSLMFGTGAGAGPGNAGDVELRWDGTDLDMLAAANNSIFKIGNGTNSFDVWLYGSAAGNYWSWDASANDLKAEDNVSLMFGTGAGAGPGNAGDVEIRWDATDLDILAAADDSIIKIGNGTNSFDVWIYGETAGAYISWDASANDLKMEDSVSLMFGTGAGAGPGTAGDVEIRWDGTDLDILGAANNLIIKIGDGTNSFDLWLYGSAAGNYWSWDASANDLKAEDNVSLMFGTGAGAGPGNAGDVELRWDGTDLDMLAAANNSIFKIGNGTNSFDVWLYGSAAGNYISWDASANDLKMEDSVSLMFGTGAGAGPGNAGDVEIRWDGTDCDILVAADDTVIKIGDGTLSADVWIYGNTGSDYVLWDASASELSLQGAATLDIPAGALQIANTAVNATAAELNMAADISANSEVVTATNVIAAAESGTTYYLNAVGGFTSTLPAPAQGMKFTFIVKTAPTTAYIITTNSGANILYGHATERAGGAGVAGAAQDTVNFVASQAIIGDRYDFMSDGTNWYMEGHVDVAAACTFSVT